MKGFGFYRSKKYLQQVLLSIMMTMVILVMASTVANTYTLEKSVKSIQEEANLKVLTQLQYNFSYMNELITHLSNFVFKDNLLIPLMFDDSLPKMDLIRGYQRMTNIMESSSFLHSMVIYNHAQNELYGTTSNFLLDGGITKNNIRAWLLDDSDQHGTSRLIPVSLEQEHGDIDAFAFIVTNSLKPFSPSESAIIFYIKSDWVFDSLKKMNTRSTREQGDILIADPDGRLYSSHTNNAYTNEQTRASIQHMIMNNKIETGRQSGFVIGDISGEKSMVTFMEDPIPDWTILYILSYDNLMEDVTQTRVKSFIVSGVFLLIAIGLSIWLSYKLYHPIENMLKRIRLHSAGERQPGLHEGDEFHAMSHHYMKLSDKLHEISSEQIVNKYYIRKFITDSQLFFHNDMVHLIQKHDLHIAVRDEILVCVLRIDQFMAYDRNTTASTKKMYSFAIVNIAQEMIAKVYPCEAAELWGDHVVLLVSLTSRSTEEGGEQLIPLIKGIQDTIERYYGLTLSCGISSKITQLSNLSAGYTQALNNSLYKIIFGCKSIVTTEDIQENITNKIGAIPDSLEKKLSEALKKGQMTEAGIELEKAFSLIAAFNYEDIQRAVSNLAWIIKNTAIEIMDNRVSKFALNLDYVHLIAQEKETLEEMYLALVALCAKICEGQKPGNMERHDLILETIKEIIHQKFADPNLGQQSIALTVKLSSAYIGKLFKDSFRMTITEYINEIRLRHAQNMLENGDYTVLEIMEKCGYSNPSYFYRLFKAKFGSTPKEYRLKKSIS